MQRPSLPIPIDEIYFGERDGLHEYMKHDRMNTNILDNSFVDPPRIKMQELYNGARYIISGPKGSGKTTLLWHLKRASKDKNSKVILFKSQIRKEDRDQLDKMIDMIVVVEDQKSYRLDADYKTIWEWYILKNIVRLIDVDNVQSGMGYYRDISMLLEANSSKFNTIYDKMYIDRVKGNIKLSVNVGALKSELAGEIEARRVDGGKIALLDLVRLVQDALPCIRLKVDAPIRLYFDELEFFMSNDGDGERDRRMVRDLLFATYTTNTLCANANLDIVVYASVRTELLNSINTTTQEINKIVGAFGVTLNWYSDDADNHPVISIIENKIKNSEVEACGGHSEDVWSTYFPDNVHGKAIKKFLLDAGLHRPRGVLLRILAALERVSGGRAFIESDFSDSEVRFGSFMLEEYADEIAGTYDEKAVDVIMNLFRGNKFAFTKYEFDKRLNALSLKNSIAKEIRDKSGSENLLRLLFRIGMIGNQFYLDDQSSNGRRDVWAFRGEMTPFLEKRFVLHRSVRRVLSTV